MAELIDKYFNDIVVMYVEYVPVDNGISDAAFMKLKVPTKLIMEYLQSRGLTYKKLDGERFVRDSELILKLKTHYNKGYSTEGTLLEDVLDYFEDGKIIVDFPNRLPDSEKVSFSIMEEIERVPWGDE